MRTVRLAACATGAALSLLAAPLAAQQPVAGGQLPAVSPEGDRIAFVSDRTGRDELYVIRADGSGEKQLTSNGAERPSWSPDGREVWHAGAGADSGRVFAVTAAWGTVRTLATVPGRSPVLSPDGRRVAFLMGPWASTVLAVSDTDGSHLRKIAGGGRTTAWNAAWSPDGTMLAYTFGDSSRVLQVHVIRADGSGDRALTHASATDGSAQMPAWSRDGSQLAIQVSTRDAGRIWIVNVATGASHAIGGGAGHREETPAWFPDGKRLACQSDATGRWEVWTMNVDGSDRRRITGTAPPPK